MMEGQFMSPMNSIKRKTQNAARRIKNGSPKIQEQLRKRFKQRMYEMRNELFSQRRPGLIDFSQDEQEVLTKIVRSEFGNVVSFMECDNSASPSGNSRDSPQITFSANQHESNFLQVDQSFEIEEEIEEQWIFEEFQRILWEKKQISSMFDNDGVTCPICLKNFMCEIPNFVICNCGLRLPFQSGLNQLRSKIQEQVHVHSATCLNAPIFSVFQDGENVALCLTCTSCDIFVLV